MIYNVMAAAICGVISLAMLSSGFPMTIGLGTIFGFTGAALLIQAMEQAGVFESAKGNAKDNAKGEFVEEPEDDVRNVRFSGRTGRDLVDPNGRPLTEDELRRIIGNAQAALRNERFNAPAKASRSVRA